MIRNVLIFGSSITYGAWDKAGGWAQHLRSFLDREIDIKKRFCYLVYNLSISGTTSEDLLARFEREATTRHKDGRTIIIFSIGVNDSRRLGSAKRPAVKAEKFLANIKQLLGLARKFSNQIIFVGLTPVDESKTTPISWNSNEFFYNKYISEYDQMIRSVCRTGGVRFIETFKKFSQLRYQKLLVDGLHPNFKGHKIIFKVIKDYLVKNKII